MRVLITGASGFTGRHVIQACLAAEHAVVATRRGPVPDPAQDACTWRSDDLCDPSATDALVREVQPDGVIHLAGRVGIQPNDDLGAHYRTNVLGTSSLLAAISEYTPQARVLVVGSAAQYGQLERHGLPVTEVTTCRPHTHYGLSKHVQEEVALLYQQKYGLPIIATRTFNLLGPGDTERSLIGKVARALACRKLGIEHGLIRVGHLDAVRDYCDVRDAAQAYVMLLEKGVPGERYNVCSGRGIPMHDLVFYLVQRAGLPVEIVEVAAGAHAAPSVQWMVGYPGKLADATGWRPRYALAQSLDDTLADWTFRLRSSTHSA